MLSAAPPAANGTTTRTGFTGHSAARTAPQASASAAMVATARVMPRRPSRSIMSCSSVLPRFARRAMSTLSTSTGQVLERRRKRTVNSDDLAYRACRRCRMFSLFSRAPIWHDGCIRKRWNVGGGTLANHEAARLADLDRDRGGPRARVFRDALQPAGAGQAGLSRIRRLYRALR